MKTSSAQLGVLVLVAVAAGFAGGFLGGAIRDDDRPVARGQRPAAPARAAEAPAAWRHDVEARLAALERRAPAAAPVAPGAEDRAAPAEPAPEEAIPEDLLEGLLGKPFDNRASNLLFWRLQQKPDRMEATIARIKKAIADSPEDPELQVALATAYVAQLLTVPAGPQQGLIWVQANAAYDEAIRLEPNHWQARFGKAFGTSMVPEFLGQRPQAIQQFEELIRLQETQRPTREHVQSYFRLGTLYKDAGNAKKAREVWERGRKLFPDSDVLREALKVLGDD